MLSINLLWYINTLAETNFFSLSGKQTTEKNIDPLLLIYSVVNLESTTSILCPAHNTQLYSNI